MHNSKPALLLLLYVLSGVMCPCLATAGATLAGVPAVDTHAHGVGDDPGAIDGATQGHCHGSPSNDACATALVGEISAPSGRLHDIVSVADDDRDMPLHMPYALPVPEHRNQDPPLPFSSISEAGTSPVRLGDRLIE